MNVQTPPMALGRPRGSLEHAASLLEECEGVLEDLRHAASRGVPPAPLLAQVAAHAAASWEESAAALRALLTRAKDEEVTCLMAHRNACVRRSAVSERGRRIASRG